MELKVGMYVRTDKGEISKILEIDEYGFLRLNRLIDLTNNKIIKANYNILKILKVGDFINGEKILNIDKFKDGSIYIEISEQRTFNNIPSGVSILTKEQYEANSYKVD